MELHHVHRGTGEPLLLIHGLGGTWQSWNPVLDGLAARREVIAVDLPGSGRTPPLRGEVSIATLTDAVESFITERGLDGVDIAGSSMGARMVLELARRGVGAGSAGRRGVPRRPAVLVRPQRALPTVGCPARDRPGDPRQHRVSAGQARRHG